MSPRHFFFLQPFGLLLQKYTLKHIPLFATRYYVINLDYSCLSFGKKTYLGQNRMFKI